MSRHKLVKALDLDEELDDFDGASEDDVEEELSPEDKGKQTSSTMVTEQLRRGIIEVREILGPNVPITTQEIEDSLYYYYYDVPKTVNYVLNKNTSKPKSKPNNKSEQTKAAEHDTRASFGSSYGMSDVTQVHLPFSAADFFKDAPWLNIPSWRQGKLMEESLLPSGRLLGGSSNTSIGPPKSKLAALATARKKENRDQGKDTSTTSSVALLDKLKDRSNQSYLTRTAKYDGSADTEQSRPNPSQGTRKYPVRRRRLSSPPAAQLASPIEDVKEGMNDRRPSSTPETMPKASPSIFAEIMFGWRMSGLRSQTPPVQVKNHQIGFGALTDIKGFAGPSPDDVVLKAQKSSKGVGTSKKSEIKVPNGATDSLGKDFKDASVPNEAPKVKRKNIDVAAEYLRNEHKRAANFVVIGHVDAGKSTLMGRLLHDLKVVDQRTVDKYRKEAERIGKASFALAWVLDQGTEERERGVTIDMANFKFETATTLFTILDAPGHRDFIPNMIAGASQADFAILVLDASIGNFESGLKGQTREHALLVRSMGVQRIIIAVNKLETVLWSKDRFDEISQQISGFLTTAGFQAKNLAFVPCSGLTGDNIVHKATDPSASWYKGAPLIEVLEASEPAARAIGSPLRLTIDDIFRGGVQNPLSVSGRLDTGTIQIGDSVIVLPASQTATIKALDVDNEPKEWAVAGRNVILHLTDIDAKYLKSGDVICPPSAPVPCLKAFSVKVLAFEHVMPMHCEVHKGRLHAAGRIVKLQAVLDKGSGAKLSGKKPKQVKPGSVARIIVEVEEAIPLEVGSRVILRAEGETVAAGLVE